MNLNDLRNACTVLLGDSPYYVRSSYTKSWRPIPQCLGYAPAQNRKIHAQRYPYRTRLYDLGMWAAPPVFSKRWHIDFRQIFAEFENYDRLSLDVMRGGSTDARLINQPKGFLVSPPEAMIFASDDATAKEVLSHVNSAMLLSNGYTAFEIDEIEAEPDPYTVLKHPGSQASDVPSHKGYATDGVYYACEFVSKIWTDEYARLALSRFHHSSRIVHHHWMDAAPSINTTIDFEKSSLTLTGFALSISAAYSVIEELRLEPRHRPGEAVYANGQWNERISVDLRERLRSRDIDPDERVIWLRRGSPSMIERKVARAGGTPASWARFNVRDRMVPLYEAILLSSRIRHRASSHATKQETRALTPIDVLNVKDTCRILLLASVGMQPRVVAGRPDLTLEFAELHRSGFGPPSQLAWGPKKLGPNGVGRRRK